MNLLGNNGMGMLGDFQNFVQQFRQFQRTFTGNPEEEVKKLVTSGKISQQQLNQIQQMAQMFQGLLSNP